MENPAHFRSEGLELTQRVLQGVPLVNDAIKPQLSSDLQVLPKQVSLLRFVIRVLRGLGPSVGRCIG